MSVPQHPKNIAIKDFTYDLPEAKMARYPLSERDASKLLVFRDGKIQEYTYRHIADHIPEGSLPVFNQTKVINARLIFQKPTGGRIEIFCLEPDARYADIQTAMQQHKEVYWKCLVGGAQKWKPGQILEALPGSNHAKLYAELVNKNGNAFIIHLYWDEDCPFAEILHQFGNIPLPPYLNREAEAADNATYQTIFAREEGSVAAPTAALHFTENVLNDLAQKRCSTQFVTLHVGAGTFMPVKSDDMQGHIMHAEWIEVEVKFLHSLLSQINKRVQNNLPVIAIGTTSARTLESLYWIGVRIIKEGSIDMNGVAVSQWYPYDNDTDIKPREALQAVINYMQTKGLDKLITRTQIIIAPGYRYRILDALITNFHQPQSTLLLLVAALIGDAWRRIYRYALDNDFRFLSYGDGCLLFKPVNLQ